MTSKIPIYPQKAIRMKKFGNSDFSTNPINFNHITKDFIEYFSNITKNLRDKN